MRANRTWMEPNQYWRRLFRIMFGFVVNLIGVWSKLALFPASVDKVLKKELGKKGTVEVKIPVRFADNHIEEYTLIYSIWYEMPQID